MKYFSLEFANFNFPIASFFPITANIEILYKLINISPNLLNRWQGTSHHMCTTPNLSRLNQSLSFDWSSGADYAINSTLTVPCICLSKVVFSYQATNIGYQVTNKGYQDINKVKQGTYQYWYVIKVWNSYLEILY